MKSKRDLIKALKRKIKALNGLNIKSEFLINDLKQLKTELYFLKRY